MEEEVTAKSVTQIKRRLQERCLVTNFAKLVRTASLFKLTRLVGASVP